MRFVMSDTLIVMVCVRLLNRKNGGPQMMSVLLAMEQRMGQTEAAVSSLTAAMSARMDRLEALVIKQT